MPLVTPAQFRVLQLIRQDPSASRDEITATLGFASLQATHDHVHNLRSKGAISFENVKARTTRVLVDSVVVVPRACLGCGVQSFVFGPCFTCGREFNHRSVLPNTPNS